MQEERLLETAARLIALDARIVHPAELLLQMDLCTIGRDTGCTMVIDRREVSRIHARIERRGSQYFLSDAGSSNHTFVNSQRLDAPHLLQSQDQISLGQGSALLLFSDPHATFVPGQLRYDERLFVFFYKNKALELTPGQMRLLQVLYVHRGRYCTRDECSRAIWGEAYDAASHAAAFDQLVTTLRARLRQIDPTTELIHTRRGIGYMLQE